MLRLLIIVCLLFSSACKSLETVNTADIYSEDYFTGRFWLVEELTYIQNGRLTHYQKGLSTQFLNDRIFFKQNGAGTYINTYNEEFDIKWTFTDRTKRKVELMISNYSKGRPAKGKEQKVKLENITVSAGSLSYTEVYFTNGSPTMSSVYRIPTDQKK